MKNASRLESARYRISDDYDLLVRIENTTVPSKRVGYKRAGNILEARVPEGVGDFEAAIKNAFSGDLGIQPIHGKIIVGINLFLPKSAYKTTDVDNMVKSVLDAFKGILFEDDCQIDALFSSKEPADRWGIVLSVQRLDFSTSCHIEPLRFQVAKGAGTE